MYADLFLMAKCFTPKVPSWDYATGIVGDSNEALEMQDAQVTLLLDDCRQHMLTTYLPVCVWHRFWI